MGQNPSPSGAEWALKFRVHLATRESIRRQGKSIRLTLRVRSAASESTQRQFGARPAALARFVCHQKKHPSPLGGWPTWARCSQAPWVRRGLAELAGGVAYSLSWSVLLFLCCRPCPRLTCDLKAIRSQETLYAQRAYSIGSAVP